MSDGLNWHFGPTPTDRDHGKMWHYDCGGEVLILKEDEGRYYYICCKCNQTETCGTASEGCVGQWK